MKKLLSLLILMVSTPLLSSELKMAEFFSNGRTHKIPNDIFEHFKQTNLLYIKTIQKNKALETQNKALEEQNKALQTQLAKSKEHYSKLRNEIMERREKVFPIQKKNIKKGFSLF